MASATIRNFRKNNIVTPTDYNLAYEQVKNILEFIKTQKDRQINLEANIASLMHTLESDKNNEDLKIEIKDAIAYAEQNKKLFDGIIEGFELYKVQNKIDQYNAKDWQAMERKDQKEVNRQIINRNIFNNEDFNNLTTNINMEKASYTPIHNKQKHTTKKHTTQKHTTQTQLPNYKNMSQYNRNTLLRNARQNIYRSKVFNEELESKARLEASLGNVKNLQKQLNLKQLANNKREKNKDNLEMDMLAKRLKELKKPF